MADIFILNDGALSPKMAKYVCIWAAKSLIVCI